MCSTLLFLSLLVLSGPCESGCPEADSPGSCSVDCNGLPGSILPAEQLQQVTRLTITNCHVTEFNWTQHSLSHLLTLDLSFNSIVDIDHSLVKCLSSLTELTLRGNAISVLSDHCLEGAKDLRTLDLSSNNISTLHGSPFESSRLVRLNISRNRISTLTERSLRGLDRLELIDLSSNLLSVLDNSLFHAFSSLQWLNLSGNHLAMLSEGYFLGLTGLQRLDVSVNCISRVSGSGAAEALSGLTEVVLAGNPLGPRHKELMVLVGTGRRLQTVDASGCNLTEIPGALTWSIRLLKLAHNQLASIRRGDLDSYPLLHELDLSNNIIADIEEDALGRLESLSTLLLVGNRLTVVPNSLSSGLRVMHLDYNNIQYLNVDDLEGLPHLKELTLKHTNMMAIQDGAFSCIPQLEVLDLSDNPLERLSGSVLAGPQTLTTLQLSHLSQVTSDVARDLSFPLSSPERLQVLELQASPVVARQLLADPAALAAFRDLHTLDLRGNQLTQLRSDLFHFLPRLEVLRLAGNPWACDDMLWLARWMKQQQDKDAFDGALCDSPPHFKARRIQDLVEDDFFTPTAKPLTTWPPTQESNHIDHESINDSLKIRNDSKGEALENQFLNKSRGSDSKLKFPSMPAASGLHSFVKTTNVDSSVDNKTHPGFLTNTSVDDEKRLKNVRHIINIFNGRSLLNSSSNASVVGDYNRTVTHNTHDTTANNITTKHSNSTVAASEDLADKSIAHDFNTSSKADNQDLYNTSVSPQAVFSEITKSSFRSNETSKQVVSDTKSSIGGPNKTWPALRNANKKGPHNSLKNMTALIKMLPINHTRGGKVFDTMMRDLMPNNPLRANENFSRLKPSSYGFRGDGVLDGSQARHTLASPTKIPSARSITLSQTPPPATAPTPLTLATPQALSDNRLPVQRNANDDDEYANTTVVWGTIKTFANEGVSASRHHILNATELLIGLLHRNMDSEPLKPSHIDPNHLFAVNDLHPPGSAEKVAVFKPSHPGMYVMTALGLGVLVVLLAGVGHLVVRRRRAVEYSRQQDIEVRSMTNVGEIW